MFDRSLHIAAGATPGTPLLHSFRRRCATRSKRTAARRSRGSTSHFSCEMGGRRLTFEVAPIQTIAGVVLYGVLIAGAGIAVPAAAQRPLTTVA